jgi:hypothetical protein
MTSPTDEVQMGRAGGSPMGRSGGYLPTQPQSQSLADVLERVLDKGIIIVGDIQVRLLDIELLTIKLRLLIASVDKAREMGVNWWENDEFASVPQVDERENGERAELVKRVRALEDRLAGNEGEAESAQPKARSKKRS